MEKLRIERAERGEKTVAGRSLGVLRHPLFCPSSASDFFVFLILIRRRRQRRAPAGELCGRCCATKHSPGLRVAKSRDAAAAAAAAASAAVLRQTARGNERSSHFFHRVVAAFSRETLHREVNFHRIWTYANFIGSVCTCACARVHTEENHSGPVASRARVYLFLALPAIQHLGTLAIFTTELSLNSSTSRRPERLGAIHKKLRMLERYSWRDGV